VLVGVFVVGEVDDQGIPSHSLPPLAAEVDAEVRVLTDDELCAFHAMPGQDGAPRIGYLPRLVSRGGDVAAGISQLILSRLSALYPEHQTVLRVLRDNVAFRSTVEVLR
jgi:hypothetical protein